MATKPKTPPSLENQPSRFAHPFFTSTPPSERASVPGVGKRMTDFVKQNLGPVPAPKRNAVMDLAEVIGQDGVQEIENIGTLRFHSTGDTGRSSGIEAPTEVAADMAQDYHPDAGGRNPAFFLHLGDLIYGPGKHELYTDQFYSCYKQYPGKILAIAGNHDGDVYERTDPNSLEEFLANFCADTAKVPEAATTIGVFRETMTQPGVYFRLKAPFADILFLYSNKTENPGHLEGAGPDGDGTDTQQLKWLAKTLKAISAERTAGTTNALIIAAHHPPYSNAGHAGSKQMLKDIDHACNAAGILPDLFLAGHAHSYQRYTRRTGGREIPFIVAGCGGRGEQAVPEASGQNQGDHTFDASLKGYGYILVSVSKTQLKVEMWPVPSQANTPFDAITLDLTSGRLL